MARAGTACRAPTSTMCYAIVQRIQKANYLTVITRFDGDAGVICADGATATAE
jgi:hypothetical protein